MRKLRVYADTSVFGGVYDETFAEASRRFFERVKAGVFVVLFSRQTGEELQPAPGLVRAVFDGLPEERVETVEINDEVVSLADAYIAAGAIRAASRGDALHVAAATVAAADLVLSWNFKDIVRYDRVQQFNAVNMAKGYRTLDIRSPLEVDYGEE